MAVYPLWSLPGDLENADVAKWFSSFKKRGLSGEETAVYPLWSLPGDLENADVAKWFSSFKKRGLSGEETAVYPLWSLPGDLENADVAKWFSSFKKRGLSGEERFNNITVPVCLLDQKREILGSSLACHSKQSHLPLPWCKHSPHRDRYLTHYTPDHQLYCPCG